jgi:nucleoid-associated protein YgaU
MKLIPMMVFLLLGLIGCSGSKSAQDVGQESPQVELSDADEFVENPNEAPASEPTEMAGAEGAPAEAPVVTDAPVVEESNNISSEATPVVSEVSSGGSEQTYKVQKNETLMMIAFKLYGDYSKWKELASQNSSVLNGSTSVRAGTELKYTAPAQEFVWNPEGLPYLIRTGDTLGTISNSVYQTTKKWKNIWNNNKPLIRDPNKIFAGFTLYYLENGRDVASEI